MKRVLFLLVFVAAIATWCASSFADPVREGFADSGPGGTHTMTTIGQTGGVDLTSQWFGSILNIVDGYDVFIFNSPLGTATNPIAISTDVSSMSDIVFLGSSNVYGDIGESGAVMRNITAGASGATVRFLGNVFTTTMYVETGTVNFNSGSTNVGSMYFTGDGTISLAPNTTVIGALCTLTDLTGTLVLGGGSVLIGAVGNMTGLKAINVVGDGVIATTIGAVGTHEISLGTNTLNIGGALTIATDGVINTTLASPTLYGHILVQDGGASNLGTGLTVNVLVPSTTYIPVGTQFYIVQSTSGTGAPATVTVQSPTNPLYTFAVDTTASAGDVIITTTSVPMSIPMTGDLNTDGAVNFTDYATIANHWMETNCEEPNNWCEGTDFDHSGSVDMLDLAILASHWLEGTGSVRVSEHVNHIEVWYDAAHDNPLDINQVEYGFDIEVVTDGNVARMEFVTPEGKAFSIPSDLETWDDANQIWTSRYFNEDGGVWEWEFEKSGSNINLFDDFGDGTYTLNVFYSDDSNEQTQIVFADPCTSQPLPMPTQIPSIIFPAYQATVESPITVSWEQCVDPNVNGIWVDLWNDAIGADFGSPFGKEQTSWESVDLNDGSWYVAIDFDNYSTAVNADGIEVGLGKSRNSEQSFTVETLP